MSGRTFNVSNATDLARVARTAIGGDTILLAPGNYGNVSLKNLNPSGLVTIKSANPNNDAVFETLRLMRMSNFVFDDIDVHHVLSPGEQEFSPAVRVDQSRDLTFVGLDIYGSLNGNQNDDGNGLWVQRGTRIAVLDSTFRELNVAAVFPYAKDLIFAGNTVSTVREGINLSEVDGVLVERNYFTGITPFRNDHSDAIQVHAGGVFKSSNDIVIRSNVIKLGTTTAQGIFIRNEQANSGLRHSNITVEDNYYEGNSRHGISVSDTVNAQVIGNTVRDIGSGGLVPGLNVNNNVGGVVRDNIATLLLTSRPNTNVTWSNNIDLWDRKQLTGVVESTLFSSPTGSADLDFSSLNVRAGSAAAAQGIGFAAVAGIGDIKASSAAILAAYLPQFDNHAMQPVMV